MLLLPPQIRFDELIQELNAGNLSTELLLNDRQKDLDVLIKHGEERDGAMKDSFDSIYKNQSNILKIFQKDLKASDDKVKEIFCMKIIFIFKLVLFFLR